MSRKTVVIAGATGLIGSRLIELLSLEYEVHCVSRSRGVGSDVIWHQVDLSAACSFEGLPKSVDAVIYLAQSQFFRDFPHHAVEVLQVNTLSALRMLDYARSANARSFIYGSSGGVYGAAGGDTNEEVRISTSDDLGFYLGSKLCSEIVAKNYERFFNVVILRYFFVYGAGQRGDMLVPRLVHRVRNRAPIQLSGCDGIRINPVHVSDAAAATMRALELTASVTINIAGPEILSLRQIGNIIGGAVGCDPIFTIESGGSQGDLVGDITRMSDLLGGAKMRFVDGIRSVL